MLAHTVIKTGLYLLLAGFFNLLLANSPAQAAITSAACLVNADGQVLLVRDSLSRRLSLPGGMLEAGETPAMAAVRETYEETGVPVHTLQHYANWEHTAVFHCQANTAIQAHAHKEPSSGLRRVYAHFAPDVGTEIQRVYLAKPQILQPTQLRAPQRLDNIQQAIAAHPAQTAIRYRDEMRERAHPFHQMELDLITRFKAATTTNIAAPLFHLFNAFGEQTLYYFLLPLLWLGLGWAIGFRLVLLLALGSVFNHLLKINFALPRPFDFIPALQSMSIWGYGLPSGHTHTAGLFWGFLVAYVGWPRYPHYRLSIGLGAALLVVATGLARLYFGVHFISDVVTGALSAMVLLMAFIHADNKGWLEPLAQARTLPWLLLAGMMTLYTALSQSTYVLSTLGLLVGLWLGLRWGISARTQAQLWARWPRAISFVVMNGTGIVLISALGAYLQHSLYHVYPLLLLAFCHYLLIAVWLSAGCYWLTSTLCKLNKISHG